MIAEFTHFSERGFHNQTLTLGFIKNQQLKIEMALRFEQIRSDF